MAPDMTAKLLYIEDFDVKTIKNGIKLLCFAVLMWALLYGLERLFIFTSPESLMMDEFLSLERNTVDLLCVGSSHAYTSCDTEVYWNDFGIPAFCISGPGQPVSASYYYLKEAFKTQKPKGVMLEASQLNVLSVDDEYRNINNVAWMPYSENRARMLYDVVDEKYRERLEWNLSCFHGRWDELSDRDFEYVLNNGRPKTKGFNPWWNYADYTDTLTVWDTEYQVEPDTKCIEYIDKIISLCDDNDAVLVVYLSAHNFDENGYGQINWYRNYFNNHNIEMIDGVQLSHELEIDPDVDMCNNHIAYTGAVKLSKYIGNYLSERQYVVDRRSEKGYKEWEEWSHYYEDTASIYSLVNAKEPEEYINALNSLENALVVITYRGELDESQVDKNVLEAIRNVGIRLSLDNEAPYIGILEDGTLIEQFQEESIAYGDTLLGHRLEITVDDQNTMSVLADYERITKANQTIPENALQIYIYNAVSGEVAESRTLNIQLSEDE